MAMCEVVGRSPRPARRAIRGEVAEAQKAGKNRFVDGISVELNFSTSAIKSIKPPR